MLSSEVVRFFQDYDWPGNIRELQNILEHASIVCGGSIIEIQHLPARIIPTADAKKGFKDKPYTVKEILARMEKELIISALDTYNNNRTNAMKALGLSRRVFYDKLNRYGIKG